MNQTPQNEKKSRFQLSREVQEEFVNGIAQTMLSLAENAEQSQPSVTETPFCPATGKGIQRSEHGASDADRYGKGLHRQSLAHFQAAPGGQEEYH